MWGGEEREREEEKRRNDLSCCLQVQKKMKPSAFIGPLLSTLGHESGGSCHKRVWSLLYYGEQLPVELGSVVKMGSEQDNLWNCFLFSSGEAMNSRKREGFFIFRIKKMFLKKQTRKREKEKKSDQRLKCKTFDK